MRGARPKREGDNQKLDKNAVCFGNCAATYQVVKFHHSPNGLLPLASRITNIFLLVLKQSTGLFQKANNQIDCLFKGEALYRRASPLAACGGNSPLAELLNMGVPPFCEKRTSFVCGAGLKRTPFVFPSDPAALNERLANFFFNFALRAKLQLFSIRLIFVIYDTPPPIHFLEKNF